MRLPRSPIPSVVCAMALLAGCGRDSSPDAGASGEPAESKPSPAPVAATGGAKPSADAGGMATPDAGALDDGGAWESAGAETEGEPAADDGSAPAEPYRGPCMVRWTTGAVLRFTYADDGASGKVRVDEDGNGKADVCGAFTIDEDRITRLEVDEGCNGKADEVLAPEYDAKANVATARLAPPGKPGEGPAITLVTMPSFTGVVPGYALQAERKAVKLSIRKGLVRRARLKTPAEGPSVDASFTYDSDGRVKRIKEDLDMDGTVDRQFDYRYDDVGNPTRMTVVIRTGDAEEKGTARLSYKCWASTKPTPSK